MPFPPSQPLTTTHLLRVRRPVPIQNHKQGLVAPSYSVIKSPVCTHTWFLPDTAMICLSSLLPLLLAWCEGRESCQGTRTVIWSLLIPHMASGPQECWLDEQSHCLVPGLNLWVPWLTLRVFSLANRCTSSWQVQSKSQPSWPHQHSHWPDTWSSLSAWVWRRPWTQWLPAPLCRACPSTHWTSRGSSPPAHIGRGNSSTRTGLAFTFQLQHLLTRWPYADHLTKPQFPHL